MAGIETIFWGWDAPLVENAVRWLAEDGPSGAALDLSETLVVVPTAEASRRLREALAANAAQRQSAIMAPYVWHPEQCILHQDDLRRAATENQTLLAWIAVLKRMDLSRCARLFPSPPPVPSPAWTSALAETFADLQTTLGAGGLDFGSVAASEHALMDRERWRELAQLERSFVETLAARGLASVHQMKAERAKEPRLPTGIKRIAVIGVADPPPLFRQWLTRVSETVPLFVCVQAPAGLATRFTPLGVPVGSWWNECAPLCISLPEEWLHVERDPSSQARKATALLAMLAPSGRVAVGTCDPTTSAHMEDQLAAEEVRTYEPGGTPLVQHGVRHIAQLWCDLITTRSWHAFASLLRVPEFVQHWGNPVSLLKAADDFAEQCLPVTIDGAADLMLDRKGEPVERESPILRKALEVTLALASRFHQEPLPDAIRSLLAHLFGNRTFNPDNPTDRATAAVATMWIQIADAIHEDGGLFDAKLDRNEALRLSVDELSRQRLIDPRGEPDLVLQGWLELLWEPSPNLVVLGCNEENLPGIMISHPFLPDSLREKLGLPSQATRYCRDAYLLAAMTEQRRFAGALHLLCGQWSEDGEALRPSRLLFLCEDRALAIRVAHLFPSEKRAAGTHQPARTIAWKIKPQSAPDRKPDTISASRLKDYLTCPFRYYLKHHLRMETVDPGKREMSAAEFGDLLHIAFKKLAAEPSMHDCIAAAEIAAFLREAVRDEVQRRYGKRLPFPVRLQFDSALQRLTAAADIEAAHRRAGWRTLHAEFAIGHDEDAHPLVLGSRRLAGKIDRIDRGPDGEILILDLKTHDGGLKPEQAHLKKLGARAAAGIEDWLVHRDHNGRPMRWLDLQLPLYARAWLSAHPGKVQAGYLLLPANIQGTIISMWDDLDEAVLDSAVRCAEEAVRRIDAQRFWPPSESVAYDSFEDLFAALDPREIVDPSSLPAGHTP